MTHFEVAAGAALAHVALRARISEGSRLNIATLVVGGYTQLNVQNDVPFYKSGVGHLVSGCVSILRMSTKTVR